MNQRTRAVELGENGLCPSRARAVGGERRGASQEVPLARPADQLPGRGSVSARHEDPGRPLDVAAIIPPLVDRAAADRDTPELDVEELEPAMLTDHPATLSDARARTARRRPG